MTPSKSPPNEILAVGVRDAGRLIGVGESKLRSMITAGQLRSIKLGGKRLVPMASLRALVAPQD